MKRFILTAALALAALTAQADKIINGVPMRGVYDPSNGVSVSINDTRQMHVVLRGEQDTNNSTTAALGISGVYTGTPTDTLDYAVIQVAVYSDVASGTDGLCVQFSQDATNWYWEDTFTVPADTGKTYSFQPVAPYYRIVYSNGATGQSTFTLSATPKKTYIKPSSHRIQDPISTEDDAELVKAVLTGVDPAGTFRNVDTTTDGDLTISDNSSGFAISKGDVTGHSVVHKFGHAPDFDQADGEVTVWDGAEDGTSWENMVYDYSSTGDIDSVSSSSGTDTQEIEIQGLDANTNLLIQTATLNGQTRVALATNMLRVFRMKNVNSTDLTGHVFVYTNNTLTAGVPDDAASIRGIIQPENNQTEMAIYTIPAGKTGYVMSWYVSSSGASKDINYVMRLKARQHGGVFQLKHKMSINDFATSSYQHDYFAPLIFTAGTDIEMTIECAASATAAAISGGFEIILVDD